MSSQWETPPHVTYLSSGWGTPAFPTYFRWRNFCTAPKTYLCPLGHNVEDTQEHLLYCKGIYGHDLKWNEFYEYIFSKNLKLVKIEEKLNNALKTRNFDHRAKGKNEWIFSMSLNIYWVVEVHTFIAVLCGCTFCISDCWLEIYYYYSW